LLKANVDPATKLLATARSGVASRTMQARAIDLEDASRRIGGGLFRLL